MPLEGKKEKHESYGMVRIHRQTGKFDNLFGSAVQSHHVAMSLEIVEAEVTHDLKHDWFYGSKIVTEILLSPHQFAELITNMNTTGVPCTIKYRHTDGFKQMEEPPFRAVEAEKVKESFQQDLSKLSDHIHSAIADAEEMLEGRKTPRKADWNKLLDLLKRVRMEVDSNMPFAVESFNEATDKIVSTAKNEIDAFVTVVAHHTGIEAIKNMKAKKLLSGTERAKAIAAPHQRDCDHEFADTNHCVKCGWEPGDDE